MIFTYNYGSIDDSESRHRVIETPTIVSELSDLSDQTSDNVLEQISELSRQFRKQIAKGDAPKIERFLAKVADNGKETLLSSLLDAEISFLRSQGESPTSAEYLKRFPQYTRLVRRAFFEPTIEPGSASDDGSSDEALAPTFEIPGANRFGDYELLRELGEGGMGVVYEARHTKTDNRVALKTLRTRFDGQPIDANKLYRFRKEFRSLSEVNHPNLVGMQTLEVDGDRWFFTMDLIEGEDFISYVRPKDQLDEDRLRACLSQLAKGIIALHQRGIVHRDLKPGNVMVTEDGHVQILDFGLVAELQQKLDATQTRTGMFVGTIPYAAPEQMFGQRTEANDWYGFGTIIYEALVGTLPFPGNKQDNLLRKQQEDPPSLADKDDVPSDLAVLVDGLLRREASARLGADAVAELFDLDSDTQIQSSTQGSKGNQGSSGSADEENPEFDAFADEEIVLVGREKQLAQLEEARQQVLAERKPQVVWITGLSGEGKSSLIEKFLQSIQRNDEITIFSGRCYDRESVPFKAIDCIIDPLVRLLRASSEIELRRILPADVAMLAHLFPLLQRVRSIADKKNPQTGSLESKQIRYRAFEALRELLVALGEKQPVVIFIDDLQWGDADSAAALHALLMGGDPPPVLFLGAYRSDERGESSFHRQWSQLNKEKEDPNFEHEIALTSLSQQQCVALVSEKTGMSEEAAQEAVAHLYENTRGNPYFLEQMIEGFNAGATDWKPMPLNDVIADKLGRLPNDSEQLLEYIAIAGKAIQTNELATVSGLGSKVLSLLTHMRSERLVRLVGSGDGQLVDTWHDKIRESTLDRMDPLLCRGMHLQFAETIESSEEIRVDHVKNYLSQRFTKQSAPDFSTDRIFDLAYHFHVATDRRAFYYQFLAGELAFQTFASDEAIEYFTRARNLLHGDEPARWQARLSHRLAVSSYRVMDFETSIEQFETGIEFTESGLERAFFHAGTASVHQTRTNYEAAAKYHDLALREIRRKRPRGFLAYLNTAISFSKLAFLPESWLRRKQRALTEEDRLEQSIYVDLIQYLFEQYIPIIEYPAAVMRAGVISHRSDASGFASGVGLVAAHLGISGFPRIPKRLADRAKDNIDANIDAETEGICRVGAGVAFYYSTLYRDALLDFEKAIPLLVKSGSHFHGAIALHMLHHTQQTIGSAEAEVATSRQLIELTQNSGDARSLCWGQYDLAVGMARCGELFEAFQMLEAAHHTWSEHSFNLTTSIYFAQRSYVFLQSSQYELARDCAEFSWTSAVRHFRVMDVALRGLAWFLECNAGPDWTRKSVAMNRGTLLRRCMYARGLAILHVSIRPHLYRGCGRIYATLGKSKKSVKWLERAAKSAEKLGMKYELAKSLLDLAAVKDENREANRCEAVSLLKEMKSVIPRAESWLLGDQYDEAVVAPEFDRQAWEAEHGPISSKTHTAET